MTQGGGGKGKQQPDLHSVTCTQLRNWQNQGFLEEGDAAGAKSKEDQLKASFKRWSDTQTSLLHSRIAEQIYLLEFSFLPLPHDCTVVSK